MGGEDKIRESGGETVQQYVDRQDNSWEITTHQKNAAKALVLAAQSA